MRFMIIRRADQITEAGLPPSRELMDAMMSYNEEMAKAGVLLQGEGLHASSKGMRVRFDGGRPVVTDGPFTETKELIAGFTIIQVQSPEEAVEWVKRWPAIDVGVELEIRRLFDPEDFEEWIAQGAENGESRNADGDSGTRG